MSEENNTTTTTEQVPPQVSDNYTSVGSSAYSFYLNVVVLNHLAGNTNADAASSEEAPQLQNEDATTTTAAAEEEESEPVGELPPTPTGPAAAGNFHNLMSTSLHNTMKVLSKSSKSITQTLNTDNALQNTMKAISQSSKAVSEKATTFVASKTMVTRANGALTKALPELVAEIGLPGMQMTRKFHEGSVFVIQVDLKPVELPDYIKIVSGVEAAESYKNAMMCLKFLSMTDSVAALEREMLPQVRAGLMDKFSDMLITIMKKNENMLEVQCIPLEETEEARWLFTFMEFRTQMKAHVK